MSKPLTDADKRWLNENVGFHIAGRTRLSSTEKGTNSDRANTRAINDNEPHYNSPWRTFALKLYENELYETFLEQ